MRVIVAEDEPAMRFVVETIISETFPESEVLGFENGRLALAAFKQTKADLVVCDQFMPVMNGTSLVRSLRRLDLELPIVMVSGSSEARALGLAAGVSAFVDKSQISHDLVDQINSLLAGSTNRRKGIFERSVTAQLS